VKLSPSAARAQIPRASDPGIGRQPPDRLNAGQRIEGLGALGGRARLCSRLIHVISPIRVKVVYGGGRRLTARQPRAAASASSAADRAPPPGAPRRSAARDRSPDCLLEPLQESADAARVVVGLHPPPRQYLPIGLIERQRPDEVARRGAPAELWLGAGRPCDRRPCTPLLTRRQPGLYKRPRAAVILGCLCGARTIAPLCIRGLYILSTIPTEIERPCTALKSACGRLHFHDRPRFERSVEWRHDRFENAKRGRGAVADQRRTGHRLRSRRRIEVRQHWSRQETATPDVHRQRP
jgi:hypothetical protein